MKSLLNKLGTMHLPLFKRRLAAVDFDSREMRIVRVERRGGSTRIGQMVRVPLPAGLETTDARGLARLLAGALGEMGLRGAAVLMNIPRSQAVLKPMVLPAAPESLAEMVRYRVRDQLPFSSAEAVIDFTIEKHYESETPAPSGASNTDVLVAAVRLPAVDFFRQVAAAAGVKLQRLGLRSYADIRCVQACSPLARQVERLAVVHVTADETEIDVLAGEALVFSRSAVTTIPQPTQATAAQADEAVGAVALEVARSLHAYQSVERGERIDVILLAGGTGIETRLAEKLRERLDVRCEMFDPTEPLHLRPRRDASAFISALGLAVGPGRDAPLPFDFLSPKRPPVRRDVRKVRAAVVAAVAAVALLTAVISAAVSIGRKKDRVVALKKRAYKLRTESRRVKDLKEAVQGIEKWVAQERNWLDHWAKLSCLLPPPGDIYITRFSASSKASGASISLPVRARNAEAIAELGKRLAEGGYKFKPGTVSVKADRPEYPYSTTIEVMIPPKMKVDVASLKLGPDAKGAATPVAFPSGGTPRSPATQPGAETGDDAAPSELRDRADRPRRKSPRRTGGRYRRRSR